MHDRVIVVKEDGTRSSSLLADVGQGVIVFESPEVPVSDGDTLLRELPHDEFEEYLVLDSGFQREKFGFPDHYASKVRKTTAISPKPTSQPVYNIGDVHISGENARFNLHSQDLSTNIVDVGADELFEKITEIVQAAVKDEEKRYAILGKLASMQKAQGTSTFAEQYKAFMASAADHMTVLAPVLPALAQLLG